jgi:hypothetical protein
MPKKRKSTTRKTTNSVLWTLPPDLESRLQVVWQSVGHLIDWCDSSAGWIQLFQSEVRPYRETFYWESVARMVADFLAQHPSTPPDEALSDCLIATQCPPCEDDPAALREFHQMWQAVLREFQPAIAALIHADLELSKQRGNYEVVKSLYAGDQQLGKQGMSR